MPFETVSEPPPKTKSWRVQMRHLSNGLTGEFVRASLSNAMPLAITESVIEKRITERLHFHAKSSGSIDKIVGDSMTKHLLEEGKIIDEGYNPLGDVRSYSVIDDSSIVPWLESLKSAGIAVVDGDIVRIESALSAKDSRHTSAIQNYRKPGPIVLG